MNGRILIVEDDGAMLALIRMALEARDFDVETATTSRKGIEKLSSTPSFELVLTDLYLGDGSGLQILEQSKRLAPQRPVIMFTAKGRLETAAQAIQAGAFDYLAKPFELDDFFEVVFRALQSVKYLDGLLAEAPRVEEADSLMIGSSPPMVSVYKTIALVAPTDTTVLITGETGTGKELVARAIHKFSARSEAPFVAIDCGSVQEALLESEMFGHEKGAFTGATSSRRGLMESAQGGTLFLDEVAETSLAFQVRLLRAIQERTIRPVGSNRAIELDIRILAATNRILDEEVRSQRFREDLYYRLKVVHIGLPPLRDRKEDIAPLAESMLKRAARAANKRLAFSSEALQKLAEYSWPGNIRQLENLVQRIGVLQPEGLIRPEDIRLPDGGTNGGTNVAHSAPASLVDVERAHIERTLQETGGNKLQAARKLGIERKSLYRKAKRFGIDLNTCGKKGGPAA